MNKVELLNELPKRIDKYDVSKLEYEDLVERTKWPSYEGYYKGFNSVFTSTEIFMKKYDAYSKANVIAYTIKDNEKVIGIFSFNEVSWEENQVNNMTIRIHPSYCNKGIGSKILSGLCEDLHKNGCISIRFDVHDKNKIAIKCYEKSGFILIETIKSNNELYYVMGKRFG